MYVKKLKLIYLNWRIDLLTKQTIRMIHQTEKTYFKIERLTNQLKKV